MDWTLYNIIGIIVAGAVSGVVITAIVFGIKETYEKEGLDETTVFKKTCIAMMGVCIFWQALTNGLLR